MRRAPGYDNRGCVRDRIARLTPGPDYSAANRVVYGNRPRPGVIAVTFYGLPWIAFIRTNRAVLCVPWRRPPKETTSGEVDTAQRQTERRE